MTKEQQNELNEYVALNFMGWKRETRKRYGGSINVTGFGFNTHLELGSQDRRFCLGVPENYCCDRAAALEVLKKIAEMNGGTPRFDLHEGVWMWAKPYRKKGDGIQSATTLELAICLYAKQAVGVMGGGK